MHDTNDFSRKLWNMAQGESDPEVLEHVRSCSRCREELDTFQLLKTLGKTAGGSLAFVSTKQTLALSSLMGKYGPARKAPQPRGDSVMTKIRSVWADLSYDTGGKMQLAGLRSAGTTGSRQVAFVSDVADLDLEITTQADAFAVVGQIGLDPIPNVLEIMFVPSDEDPLEPDPTRIVSASIDAQGYFKISVGPGSWVASLALEDAVVLFPGVQL